MMRRLLGTGVLFVGIAATSCAMFAQGTKLWNVDRYDEFAKGSSEGVAIRSDGRLEAGPATSQLATTGGSYVWSLTSDPAGNGYAGLGGTSGSSAVVMKITPDGKTSKIFEGEELGVQALRLLDDGSLIAATSPDGKLYRIPAAGGEAKVLFDPATTSDKPRYLWDVAELGDNLFVATGAPASVYRVPKNGGAAELLFRTADQHIRCLLATGNGTLWAGSDGSGVIYRISPGEHGAKPFAVYAAPRREITALATDASGDIYAAGVGSRGASPLPPLPVTGAVGVSITFVQPGSATAASTNSLVPEGSEIYRINRTGTPSKLLTLKDDVVYALNVRNGTLLAATGNRGRIYRIETRVDTEIPGRFTDVAHLEAAQAMAFTPVKDGLLVATSNSGKVFKLRDRTASPASYTSAVFDAQGFAQWGRFELRTATPSAINLYVRIGNVENPLMGWSDWAKVPADAPTPGVPAARFAQWKIVLREGGTVDAVGLNYLQANIAPIIDDIAVQPGARIANASPQTSSTVQIAFATPAPNPLLSFQPDANTSPLTAQKDKSAVTARWAAHDDNGDDLLFAVSYKGVGETNWHLLKDKISDRYLSFDASLLPDGQYQLKVAASDSPVHTDAEALQTDRISEVFVIDTTPPIPGTLTASIEGDRIHAHLEAHDATSPISHAEYSVDAGPWQYLEPVGRVSDAITERYDFTAPIPHPISSVADSNEHLVAVRIYDRYENVAAVKAIVKAALR